MDKRTAEIEQQISSAEENEAAAKALRLDLEKQAEENKHTARQYLDEAAKRAEELQSEILAEARKESEAIMRRTREETRLEKEKAWAELKTQVGELSLLLASKVIHESLDEAQHQHLIEQTLNQLETLDKEGLV